MNYCFAFHSVCVHRSTSFLLCLGVENEDQTSRTKRRDKYDFVTRSFVFEHYCKEIVSLQWCRVQLPSGQSQVYTSDVV